MVYLPTNLSTIKIKQMEVDVPVPWMVWVSKHWRRIFLKNGSHLFVSCMSLSLKILKTFENSRINVQPKKNTGQPKLNPGMAKTRLSLPFYHQSLLRLRGSLI